MVLEFFCPICQEEYLGSDVIYITRCGHVFHQKCLHDWLATQYTCPDCRTPCTPRDSFKVFIKSRDSDFVNEMIKLMDENDATICELKLKLTEATTPKIIEDLKRKSILQQQEIDLLRKQLDNNSNTSKEIENYERIIKDLENKLRDKSIEFEKERRKSTLMIVEKMKLTQQLTEARTVRTSSVVAKTANTDIKNLNIQLNRTISNASGVCNTVIDGAANNRSAAKSERLDKDGFELFKYSRRLYGAGYKHVFHQDNVIYIRKDNASQKIKIENKNQVDELMRKEFTFCPNGARPEVSCDDQYYAV